MLITCPFPPFLCFQSIDPGQQFTWEHSNLEVNKPKNRYANVIAYDHSRVLLSAIEGKTFFLKKITVETKISDKLHTKSPSHKIKR